MSAMTSVKLGFVQGRPPRT